jgi:hypothetical protein
MGNHENFESSKAADSVQQGKLCNLSAYSMERGAAIQSGHDQNNGLVEKGILPSIGFMEMSSEVRTGTPAAATEFKDSGVKVQHGKDGSTTGEYPSGVKIESSKSDKSNIELHPMIETEPPNHLNEHGEVIDPRGRVIARRNDNGSVTVDSGNGFYTQYADGTINRESAIRSRDGKNFAVIDTNTPLGGLRPSDMTKHHN